MDTATTKTCIRCREAKKLDDFSKDSQRQDGLCAYCRMCRSASDKARYHSMDPERRAAAQRNRTLRSRYGIDHAEYEAMFDRQSGRCAICDGKRPGAGKQFFCVDHDHRTGEVRGLLCWDCNVALGKFRDDPAILMKAAAYIEGVMTYQCR